MFRRRRRSAGRSARKTRWIGSTAQGNGSIVTDAGGGYGWACQWVKWPAGRIDTLAVDLNLVEPSDETLVRTIVFGQLMMDPGAAGGPSPINVCAGLIAFDGGEFPEFYENAFFVEGSSFVAPPHPIVRADDDWIWRFSGPSLFGDIGWSTGGGDLANESKAKRKLPPGTGILFVVGALNYLGDDSLHGISWTFDFRMAVRSGYTI